MPITAITPYLTVSNARAALDFYQRALGGTLEGESHLMPGTDKIMHARINIHGGLIMLADDFAEMMACPSTTPEALGGSPVVLALHVQDAQAFWDQAVGGGATVTMPLADTFWGERYGQFTDPFGHRWSVSQTLHTMTDQEVRTSADATLAAKGTLMPEMA